MVKDYKQDPQDWRSQGDARHGMAPIFRENAKNDPDYEPNFYKEKGYAAHAFLEILARPYRHARGIGWTSAADDSQSAGDISHATGAAIENTDIEGGASVRRTTPEA
ncbi:hypothetical protein AB4305_30705 [Nocardia sp. 2YAB30]|uniref:hypothetical protein n=1 Tax=Nocardia sp. 2YAB30 TaxID=3233022 RepID=UPI003F988F5B